jgi:anhydro-N-acetylmuramic acid kinase
MADAAKPGYLRALGLMSGTSLDGIDIALIETDGTTSVRRGAAATVAYPPAFRARLVQAIQEAREITARRQRPGILADIEREITERHAEIVTRFMGQHSLQPAAIDVIGFHGQTVLHKDQVIERREWLRDDVAPQLSQPGDPLTAKLTVQLGDGPLLAKLTGIDVVYDLRAADCASGGQGAPLVPVYHRALVAKLPQRPVAIVNIGGVANVTCVSADGHLIAFDTGPGNALIDDWMVKHANRPRDDDGATAAQGTVAEDVVRFYLSHSFFGQLPPKSLDRNAFFSDLVDGLSLADGAATLTAFTALSIARAREHFPQEPQLWVICGGGRRNKTIMSMLAAQVQNAVVPAEAVGLDGDAIEAEAWGYLAVRSVLGLPITFPGTTGVDRPMTGGVLARAPKGA